MRDCTFFFSSIKAAKLFVVECRKHQVYIIASSTVEADFFFVTVVNYLSLPITLRDKLLAAFFSSLNVTSNF